MPVYNIAAIDIGSNAVRLLVKTFDDTVSTPPVVTKHLFLRLPIRLGEDVFGAGKITRAKREKLAQMMTSFLSLMKVYDVQFYRCCATSAMRDAVNRKKVVSYVKKKTGLKIEVIEGATEAQLIYGNRIEMSMARNETCAFVDVGGGSTEVTFVCRGARQGAISFNLGTVRMLQLKPAEIELKLSQLKRKVQALANGASGVPIIGSGGNCGAIYRLVREGEGLDGTLKTSEMREMADKLAALTDEEKIAQYGLRPDRADVIVPASRIYLTVAEALGTEVFQVPELGLADGIADAIYRDIVKVVKREEK